LLTNITLRNYLNSFTHPLLQDHLSIKLIQYCNNYYENEHGTENLLNWKDFDNFAIIINNAGYVFVNDNRKVFIEIWNKLIDA
jgi:hypothetical protein